MIICLKKYFRGSFWFNGNCKASLRFPRALGELPKVNEAPWHSESTWALRGLLNTKRTLAHLGTWRVLGGLSRTRALKALNTLST